jgi:hypothetical protein
MKNSDLKPNRFFSTSDSTFEPEIPYMISEGRLENMEEIADQIKKLEKREKKFDPLNSFMSICGALFLSMGSVWWAEQNLSYQFIIGIITVSSGAVGFICFL